MSNNKPHWVYVMFGWWQNLHTNEYGKPKKGDFVLLKGEWCTWDRE
jgi:hypothetical protein